jgi:hypothetical protein
MRLPPALHRRLGQAGSAGRVQAKGPEQLVRHPERQPRRIQAGGGSGGSGKGEGRVLEQECGTVGVVAEAVLLQV